MEKTVQISFSKHKMQKVNILIIKVTWMEIQKCRQKWIYSILLYVLLFAAFYSVHLHLKHMCRVIICDFVILSSLN